MRELRGFAVLSAIAILVQQTAAGQASPSSGQTVAQASLPARDGAARSADKGRVRGRVFVDGSEPPTPIIGARISISAGTGTIEPVFTDATGQFEVIGGQEVPHLTRAPPMFPAGASAPLEARGALAEYSRVLNRTSGDREVVWLKTSLDENGAATTRRCVSSSSRARTMSAQPFSVSTAGASSDSALARGS
jgi:hypothetical protein